MILLLNVYDISPKIYGENVLFLYKILSQRKTHQNISHKELPNYEQHKEFVSKRPYKEWLIAYNNTTRIGSVYITNQDELGLFILEEYQDRGYGGNILKLLFNYHPKRIFFANINPTNHKSINFFKKHGFIWNELYNKNNLQVTYIKP